MSTIALTPLDLALAAVLVLLLALFSHRMKLGVSGRILVAAIRTTIQLALVGLVLKALFEHVHLGWMTLVAAIMLTVAAREVFVRQERRFLGWWGPGIGGLSMLVSSFSITVLALFAVVQPEPWYAPRYAIPLLGMMIGNTMTGVALALNDLTRASRREKGAIEARLMLGQSWKEAIETLRRGAMRTGVIPMVNAMAAAGLVSLPGMMTGQILAGNPPTEAVKYQILIMFMIAAGTGFGVMVAVTVGSRRLFDERERLRLDRVS
ncbi:MAG: ABC transporter permease [Planctomycetota bacterium]|jgi:putative ABC transport system permease protein